MVSSNAQICEILKFSKHLIQDHWVSEEKVVTKLSSMASEAVRNIKTVKSFANEGLEAKRYHEKLLEKHRLSQRGQLIEPILENLEKVKLFSWSNNRRTKEPYSKLL